MINRLSFKRCVVGAPLPHPPRFPVDKGVFKSANLILEDNAVLSHYLHAKSERISKKNRYHYPSATSIALLAHKEQVFIICNVG